MSESLMIYRLLFPLLPYYPHSILLSTSFAPWPAALIYPIFYPIIVPLSFHYYHPTIIRIICIHNPI